MKKVLCFLQVGVGGAERMTVLFGKMLNRSKFCVKFYLIRKGETSCSIADFIPKDFCYVQLEEMSPIKLIFEINKIIRNERPNIVFSSVFYLNSKILIQRFLFPRVKFIIRCENYLYTFSRRQRLVVRLTYNQASKIITQTEEMKDELVNYRIDADKIFVLHNPVDKNTIEKKLQNAVNPFPSNGKKHLLASGRFAYQKGFDLLVEAFCLMRKQRNDVDLFIVGENGGFAKEEYERVFGLIKKYNLEEDIHCVGFQTNPYIFVKYADAFVLSSRWEGLPNVLIEALYLGTPVASFKCIPIIERIVDDGVNGFLALSNDVGALKKAMEKALDLHRVEFHYYGASDEDVNLLFNI